ncbi:hypothetical protein D3248_05110 [Leucobacter zeae]|nr:hypothetical protein [Leucobacter zeae]
MEHFPSATLDDWQAYAEALVLARVTDEARIAPPEESSSAQGVDIAGRTITAEVITQIWADPKAPERLGRSFTTDVSGWFEEDGKATEVAFGRGSRIEVGHEYIMALKRYPEVKDGAGTDPTDPASWGIIGSSSVLPADGGVIGQGEYLGVEDARIDPKSLHPDSMLAQHFGQSVDAFVGSMSDFHRVHREPVIEEPGGGDPAE